MATKAKSASKATTKKAKTTRTTAAAARTTKKSGSKVKTVGAPVTKQTINNRFATINASALVAELVGTFLLVAAIMAFSGNAFFVGVSLAIIAVGIFAISGAHLNPAVSFGWWTMRKISAVKMVTYWVAQFVGAMAALLVLNAFTNNSLAMSFNNFVAFDWKIFSAELIGASVLMFGIAAAVNRGQTDFDKAAGIGLSLFLGLAVATGFLAEAAQNNISTDGKTINERLTKIEGAVLNPAVALAVNETTAPATNPLETEQPQEAESPSTRLNLEVILGTLIGAALGGNLYLLLLRNREN